MELDDKVTQLEDEIKILKNEIQAVLLDLRESYLNLENPVSRELPPFAEQHIMVSAPQQSGPPQPQAAGDEPPAAPLAGQLPRRSRCMNRSRAMNARALLGLGRLLNPSRLLNLGPPLGRSSAPPKTEPMRR